jgi:hypothetical protein
MNAIGGYFELELGSQEEYHLDAIRVNTGRNALEYILKVKGFEKIFLPYYTCRVLQQPLERLGISVEYYSIDQHFEPIFNFDLLALKDAFLYTNYFGLKGDMISRLSQCNSNIIIDNAQAFFAKPAKGTLSFNSARKFFGVPDGSYIYIDTHLDVSLDVDYSYNRFAHLLLRADKNAEEGYQSFVQNDERLDNYPLRKMSEITRKILSSIDYSLHIAIRRSNYVYLNEALCSINELSLPLTADAVPMAYPFLTRNGAKLRTALNKKRIYVAQYWGELCFTLPQSSIEYDYASNLLPIPLDQRLSKSQLDFIINTIYNEYQREIRNTSGY